MAAALTLTLTNADFQNWLRASLAVLFAREGLADFVSLEITDFQRDLLQTLYTQTCITAGTTGNVCTTANVLACPTDGFCSRGKRCRAHDSRKPDKIPNQACPNGLCTALRDAIRKEHRFKSPTWRNTDVRLWCSDSFEISKCFMSPYGYFDKSCVADTDFNGILAILINNKRFQTKMSAELSVESNICTKARNIGREIRHSSEYLLSDHDLSKYISDLITLLSDPVYLAADAKAMDAVEKLNQLKINTLTIHHNDITKVLTDNITETFRDQHKQAIHAIQQHFNDKESATMEVIDSVIAQKMQILDKYKDSVIHEMQAQPSGTFFRRLLSYSSWSSSEKELRRELIKHYREHESTIPIAPLVENNDVPRH